MSALTGEVKEWVKVTHSPSGGLATVTLVSGNYTAKWGVKFYPGMSGVKRAVKDARFQARKTLTELLEAIAELDEEAEAA